MNEPADAIAVAPPIDVGAAADEIELLDGKGLSPDDCTAIARSSVPKVLFFAGTANSGKTTLLSTLYMLFQRGSFCNYNFAGSATLIGFEERTHLSRVASRSVYAAVPRTRHDPEMLHLRVRPIDDRHSPTELLMCDLPGESFREAKDSGEACLRLPVIRRADHVVLLIDGEKIVDSTRRQQARNDATGLLTSLVLNGVLPSSSAVDIIFTKWDMVELCSEAQKATDFAAFLEEDLRRLFGTKVCELRFGRVAAYTVEAKYELGFGLKALFPAWAAPVERRTRPFQLRLRARYDTSIDQYALAASQTVAGK